MCTVFICIPVHNRIKYTIECIESILDQNYKDYKIVITDDGSTDGTPETLNKKYPEIVVIKGDGNLWWAGATNKCIEYVLEVADESDYVFTLNNDTKIQEDTLETLIQYAHNINNSIIGAVNVFACDGQSIEHSAFKNRKFFGLEFIKKVNRWGESADQYTGLIEVDALSGKGVLIPIRVFRNIGLYNSDLLPHYHADTEFTIRAKRNGYKKFLCYDAKVLSHQHMSGIGTRTSKPNIREFIKSFSSIKSTHHLSSLKNKAILLHGKKYRIQYAIALAGILLGFAKRYFLERIIRLG